MWGLRSDDPPRDALIATAALVTGALVFSERFDALPAAVAAYAGAAWVPLGYEGPVGAVDELAPWFVNGRQWRLGDPEIVAGSGTWSVVTSWSDMHWSGPWAS